ncbi:MAG: hypothetical protein IT379_22325, partial [Deltaproteobacteria bacterium]|nr:hypothetical protein [Deltaproteobacteria bacterium]
DVWAVGGTGTSGAFAWRWDGSSWRDEPLPDGLVDTTSLFKVWGNAADDVWLVGSRGTILHWDGSAFTAANSTTTRTLTTVHTTPDRVVAVGGFGSGTIVQRDIGGDFRDVSPEGAQQTMGVWLVGSEDGWASGINGSLLRYREGMWTFHDTGFNLAEAFHAVWVDPDGGVWAVGGQVLSEPLVQGIMLHRGAMIPGGTYRE